MLVGDAGDARDELAVDARPQLDGGAVRADDDGVARRDRRAASASAADELELGRRALERELADALDERAGEERPVADEPELAEEVLVRRLRRPRRAVVAAGSGAVVRRPRGQRAVRRSAPSRRRRRSRARRARRRRPRRAARARRRSARRASRSRRARRAPARSRPGAAAAGAPRGSAACRRARAALVAGRTRSAQPTASPWNIVIAITFSARSASARTRGVGGGLVAGDDQQADRLGVRVVLVGGRGPGRRDAAAVRGRREVEGAAAGLALEAERVRGLGEPGAAAATAARPDEDRALGRRAAARRARCRARPGRAARAAAPPGPVGTLPVGP